MSTKASRSGSNDAKQSIYVAAAGATLLISFADYTKNGDTSAVKKVSDLTLKGTDYGWIPVLLAFAVIGCFLCWIYTPQNRVEAFWRGISALSLLTFSAPYQQGPLSNQSPVPPPAAGQSDIGSGFAISIYARRSMAQIPADTALVRVRSSDGDTSGFDALVTLRDNSGSIVARQPAHAAEFHVAQPAGQYTLEIEANGYRRTRSQIALGGQGRIYEIVIEHSSIPLALQRLYPPADVIATEVPDAQVRKPWIKPSA